MKNPRGFTLVECLVILFILSLVIGVASFSMGIFKSSHDLENMTQALHSRLRLAQMEALFEQASLGVSVTDQGYAFYRQSPEDKKWVLITDDSLFKSQQFPSDTKLKLSVNGKSQSTDPNVPQLILQQGLLSPFEMVFEDSDHQAFQIGINEEGEIQWSPL